jgi:antitoxin (DNA-binding transcriptional repressor) of toxin-antitoxin stability system
VIHISEAEAASDFAALMTRVRAGAKVIIENSERPVAVLHAAEPVGRSISECIALAKAHEEETGKAPVLDPDFAEDVEEILSHRKPWNPPAWELSSIEPFLRSAKFFKVFRQAAHGSSE